MRRTGVGVLGAAAIFVVLTSVLPAQTAYRLKGVSRTAAGVVATTINAEAIIGFRGDQFTGQKNFTATSNDKGEWTLLGLTAGVWMFTATAPGMLPAVHVLPVKFAQRQMQSAQGGQLTWSLPQWLTPADEFPSLAGAAPLVAEGRTLEALQFLSPALADDAGPALKCAAGQVALAIKQPAVAQQLFAAILKADPKDGCGPMGLASVAMLINDWDTASKMLWTARELVHRDQRTALASAITELQQVNALK
jgi:hypothetical protein